MRDTDNAVEVIKAAMEKENAMMENSNETTEKQTDMEGGNEIRDNKVSEDTLDQEVVDDKDTVETESDKEATDDNSDEKSEKSVKSFFKSGKSKELAAKDQKIEELTDRLMRTMAEFDNYRKRTEKEKSSMFDMGVKSMLEKMLPIVDNFERGFGTLTEKEKEGAFAQGIELIYKQLMTALDEVGLKPIDAVGKEFDPNLHNAVMHGEDDSMGENIVSDEFQKGYTYHDMVVRHSMVKVVN